jgi:hypothetical protein
MALNVDSMMTANPPSIPAAGGSTTVTFQASTDHGAGQLTADYAVDPGAAYSIVGPTTLPPTDVSVVPRSYDMPLTFQQTAGGAFSVLVTVTVVEVGTGDTTVGHCLVNVDIGAGAGGAAAPLGS